MLSLIAKKLSLSSKTSEVFPRALYLQVNCHKMKKITLLYLLFFGTILAAQPKFELTPQGFAPVEIPRPQTVNEKLIEITRSWADSYNKREYDIYDVTENSMTVDAVRENAFYYRNVGETFYYKIVYSLKLTFGTNTITAAFSVKEIFQKKTPVQSTIADYYTSDGKLKEDFEDIKPSLEQTANGILYSYSTFIAR